MNFADIEFGRASAEVEGADLPNLLLEGYLDAQRITEAALGGEQFIFLGYKGAGKTALGERLRLLSASDPLLFARHIFLSDFPFKSFNKIIGGSAEAEARYPAAWSWLLLIVLFESLERDEGASAKTDPEFAKVLTRLRSAGILPAASLSELVLASSKRSFKVKLPFDLELDYEAAPGLGDDVSFVHVVTYLRDLASRVKSSSRHILIIDGLDDILTARDVQYQSLAALVTETMRLNLLFREHQSPFKIVLLCRTDLFERLPGPNKNKIRQDFAVEFDWYHDPRSPKDSKLVTLANLRARLTYPDLIDVIESFFPKRIEPPKKTNSKTDQQQEMYEYLLNNTRHTPRDFLQLLKYMQKYYKGERFTREQILSGIRDYSIHYFMPEIRDELTGYLDQETVESALKLISALRSREFTLHQLAASAVGKPRYADFDLERVLELMYECSALGHVNLTQEGRYYFSFKFRNRHSSFNAAERVVLHRGIWKAMNLV
jgi:phosphoglycolate phosphatase-like HAD superfamily hydrolase